MSSKENTDFKFVGKLQAVKRAAGWRGAGSAHTAFHNGLVRQNDELFYEESQNVEKKIKKNGLK